MGRSHIRRILSLLLLSLTGLLPVYNQSTLDDCRIERKGDALILENSRISVEFRWNEGDLRARRITNRVTSHSWELPEGGSGTLRGADSIPPVSAHLKVYPLKDHVTHPGHLVGEVTVQYAHFDLCRTFRIYPDVGAISMTLSVKKAPGSIGSGRLFEEGLLLPGKQWKYHSVEFFDVTDWNNNLVHHRESLGFRRPLDLRGNVLVATDMTHDERIFLIKEAPLGESQLYYPGFDFQVQWGEIRISNLGALYPDVPDNTWVRCYGYALGTGGESDLENLVAIRGYLKGKRKPGDGSEEMVMMNTWGDRGQDGKISEAFSINELKKGKQLGITHLQLDDGWQQGLSKNSKSASGNLWDQWSRGDWEPHSARFPSGLGPVMDVAADLGIEIGLWFHPSNADSYASWQDDAEIIMGLYERHGIRTIKIDGMKLDDKNSDIHMRNIFESVKAGSGGAVSFNVDATADRRGGYFYMNEYGNIFLENRYTDWGNYYPHWTLRNLWQLSEFVPPEQLQIEFLNYSRNPHMYDEEDPLRPSNIPFDYIFATTMAGQPLAFMEASGLPGEAFSINHVVESYRAVMHDFHRGTILPVGDMPDGGSWTGFQSISDDKSGYFLIYRENHDDAEARLQTYLPAGQKVSLEKITGSGSSFDRQTGDSGEIEFELPGRFTFGLFRYSIESIR